MATACIPQALLFFFFVVDMKIIGPAIWCLCMFLISEMLGLWFVFRYLQQNRSRFPFAFNQPRFDISVLRDVYLHPCLKLENDLAYANASSIDGSANYDFATAPSNLSSSSSATATSPRSATASSTSAPNLSSTVPTSGSYVPSKTTSTMPDSVTSPSTGSAGFSYPSTQPFFPPRKATDKKRSHTRMQSQDFREWSSTQTIRGGQKTIYYDD
jgi:hypothetical protein